MLGVHFVKEDQGVREECFLGRAAGTPAITSIVQQIDRSVRKPD
jgi:hypothetical protein